MNPLEKLSTFGQSPWLDDMRRGLITGGGLQHMIDDDGVRGLTSNPAIFEESIARSGDYDGAIRRLSRRDKSVEEIYQILTTEDVQNAADLFRPLYDETGGADGFVSYEVSPRLAKDTEGTLKEARHLWKVIDCPNLMIKVPATQEGLPVIKRLISEGINVNVTLIFGLPRYKLVTKAYMDGLKERLARGESVQGIASVASFFLSRIDTILDPQLEEIKKEGGERGDKAAGLIGEVAVASAKMAYVAYKEIFEGPDFAELAAQGAKPQRLLWASTGTKNPAYAAGKYIEPLIGPNTVNTMAQKTLNLYRKSGEPALTIEQDADKADKALTTLESLGISIDEATQKLEDEGVEKFITPFGSLMETITKARDEATAQVAQV
ncbi:MAG: Transaldolase [uncultured Truepera sp.]|uniref:Transaldolase n=1 Tax=uncultured Truepera sp. TaxID=543023 RepID=A0A6J4V8S8_9DEIN|nr:MAG: Transaldolase [uncultured Truepera sp.]